MSEYLLVGFITLFYTLLMVVFKVISVKTFGISNASVIIALAMLKYFDKIEKNKGVEDE